VLLPPLAARADGRSTGGAGGGGGGRSILVCLLRCTAHRSSGLAHRAAVVDWAICAAGWLQYALAGLQHASHVLGRHRRSALLSGPQVGTGSMPSPYSWARTAWLAFALSALCGITACTAATSPSSPALLAPYHHQHHLPVSLPLPLSRVHVPALAVRSSALTPAATGRRRSLRRRPPAPTSPPTASFPPPPPPLVTLARISALSCVCTTTSFA
jgi:hypothetical protein